MCFLVLYFVVRLNKNPFKSPLGPFAILCLFFKGPSILLCSLAEALRCFLFFGWSPDSCLVLFFVSSISNVSHVCFYKFQIKQMDSFLYTFIIISCRKLQTTKPQILQQSNMFLLQSGICKNQDLQG
jgi:hypothetical protein